MQQFDPNIPNLISGDITTIVVRDPAADFPPFEVGNHVLDPTEEFQVDVTWEINGLLRPLWLKALAGNWNVQLFAESLGGGPEQLIASDNNVPADPTVFQYQVRLRVAGGTLPEGNPGSNVSGIYKLVVAVFLNSNLGRPGFDMVGFSEGPIVQVEDQE
jgi:hypothetical protein